MYAKIEKGNSGHYMLLEVKTQVSFGPKRTTGLDTWDYMNAQEQTEGQCGDDSEHSGYARGLFELLGIEADTPVLLLPEPNYKPRYGCADGDAPVGNVTVSCINVDGVSYLTTGSIFVVNDRGQTIQRV